MPLLLLLFFTNNWWLFLRYWALFYAAVAVFVLLLLFKHTAANINQPSTPAYGINRHKQLINILNYYFPCCRRRVTSFFLFLTITFTNYAFSSSPHGEFFLYFFLLKTTTQKFWARYKNINCDVVKKYCGQMKFVWFYALEISRRMSLILYKTKTYSIRIYLIVSCRVLNELDFFLLKK